MKTLTLTEFQDTCCCCPLLALCIAAAAATFPIAGCLPRPSRAWRPLKTPFPSTRFFLSPLCLDSCISRTSLWSYFLLFFFLFGCFQLCLQAVFFSVLFLCICLLVFCVAGIFFPFHLFRTILRVFLPLSLTVLVLFYQFALIYRSQPRIFSVRISSPMISDSVGPGCRGWACLSAAQGGTAYESARDNSLEFQWNGCGKGLCGWGVDGETMQVDLVCRFVGIVEGNEGGW